MKHYICAILISFLIAAPAAAEGVYVFQDTATAADSFVRALEESGLEIAEIIHTRNLSADDVAAIAQRRGAELVIAVGPNSLYKSRNIHESIPLVHGLAHYVSADRENATWVSATIPAGELIDLILQVMPHLERLGVVHSEMAQRFVTELRGVNRIEIESRKIAGIKESAQAFVDITKALRGDNRGALLLAGDGAIFKWGDRLEEFMLKVVYTQSYTNAVPIIAFTEPYGGKGAVLLCQTFPHKMGEQAADLAKETLRTGNVPEPVSPKYYLRLNKLIASRMGIPLTVGQVASLENLEDWAVVPEEDDRG